MVSERLERLRPGYVRQDPGILNVANANPIYLLKSLRSEWPKSKIERLYKDGALGLHIRWSADGESRTKVLIRLDVKADMVIVAVQVTTTERRAAWRHSQVTFSRSDCGVKKV